MYKKFTYIFGSLRSPKYPVSRPDASSIVGRGGGRAKRAHYNIPYLRFWKRIILDKFL